MNRMQTFWHWIWQEPFSWIRDSIFQPAKFKREFGEATLAQRTKSMLRLALPLFLVCYPFALVCRAVFIALHLVPFSDLASFLVAPILGIAGGIAGGIAVGIAVGIAGGIAGGIAFIASLWFSLLRLPLYPISGLSLVRTYLASKNNPPAVFTYLHQSALYWDERVYLPLPYLKRILRLAAKENVEQALAEIAFITAERPQQLRAARAIASEIAVGELEMRKSLRRHC